MALKSTVLLNKALPALHRFGYTTSDCAVLLAVADAENGNAHNAVLAAYKAGQSPKERDMARTYCSAGARWLGFNVGVTTSAALLTLQKAERDGILDVRRSEFTNRTHHRKMNASALECLVERANFLRSLNRRKARDAKKPNTIPLDFTPYVEGNAMRNMDWRWLRKELPSLLVRADLGDSEAGISDFETVFYRDAVIVRLKGMVPMERYELIRAVYKVEKNVHDNRKGAKGAFRVKAIEVPCIRIRLKGVAPDPSEITEMTPFIGKKIEVYDDVEPEVDEEEEWAKWSVQVEEEAEDEPSQVNLSEAQQRYLAGEQDEFKQSDNDLDMSKITLSDDEL